MIRIENQMYCPSLEEICEYVKNPLFRTFCSEMNEKYQTIGEITYSKCSWVLGWNVKFRKSGKSLCTIYPKEHYFTVLIVIGKREKEQVESLLLDASFEIQEIYQQTKEGNGQKWLMIDLKESNAVYDDVLHLIEIRNRSK